MRIGAVAALFAATNVMSVQPTAVWNRAGHMVSGAIAYQELLTNDATALSEVVRVLKEHPEFETRWAHLLNQSFVTNPDLYLFMLAARWPDDIRGDEEYDNPRWHFINYYFKPKGTPSWVQPEVPSSINILSALNQNVDVVSGSAPDSDKAIALCWIFHLIGDLHQPLHTAKLFTTQFPDGDRGATRFYIKAVAGSPTISLHKFWDDLIIGSSRYGRVRNRSVELRERPGHSRGNMNELDTLGFDKWAFQESFDLAKRIAYHNGTLEGSTNDADGAVLPDGYIREVKPVAERRIVLAGYRLADLLADWF